jgi:membrane protease YdiL (CAAX protease family)
LLELLFVLLFTVVWPAYAAFVRYPRLRRAVEAGVPGARIAAYRGSLLTQWPMAALGVWIWIRGTDPDGELRRLHDLGLAGGSTSGTVLAFALAVALGVFLIVQQRALAASAASRAEARRALAEHAPLLPHGPAEFRWFVGVSVTAGVCEEILFRGFLTAWLAVWLPLWVAAAVATVVFGLAHAYQGRRGILQTGAAGAVFAALALIAGNLGAAMLLHAVVDLGSGRLAYRLMGAGDAGTPSSPEGISG